MREIRTLRATWRGLETWCESGLPGRTGAPALDPTHPTSVPAGTIERRESTDSNGHRAINWIGQESFVKAMMPPVRRVVNIFTGNQVYDAFKARWR